MSEENRKLKAEYFRLAHDMQWSHDNLFDFWIDKIKSERIRADKEMEMFKYDSERYVTVLGERLNELKSENSEFKAQIKAANQRMNEIKNRLTELGDF